MIVATPANLTPEQAQAYADRILAALERSKVPKAERVTVGFAPPMFDGPSLWSELHNYRWTGLASFRKWFDKWLDKVDRLPGCSCSQDFRTAILPKFRLNDISNDDEWFVRSWEIHNAVNRKLGKQQFPLEEAKARRSVNTVASELG
jgi:hypothetical protein